MGFFDYFKKDKKKDLDKGLEKTKENLLSKVSKSIIGKSKVDDETLDQIEEALVSSDVSIDTTVKIIDKLEAEVKSKKFMNEDELFQILHQVIIDLMEENNVSDFDSYVPDVNRKPHVIMVVGVNGVGKTTTIGKLAHQYKKAGKRVLLGAADTFRAAAVNQLKIWSERTGADFVEKGQDADPSSVAYDALQSGVAKGVDIIIIDTAGRLHNKVNLMNELGKIKAVMSKVIPEAPHEVMLVLDGSTGQNALRQAQEFSNVTDITSLALTKIDGTAKGGVVISIADQLKVPIKYIGVGEGMEHLQLFNKKAFISSIFEK